MKSSSSFQALYDLICPCKTKQRGIKGITVILQKVSKKRLVNTERHYQTGKGEPVKRAAVCSMIRDRNFLDRIAVF